MSAGITASLFTQALHVLNRVLDEHRDSKGYQQLVDANQEALANREIGIAVYDTDPSSPFDYFTVRFHEGSFELVSRDVQAPGRTWKVPRAYLETIVDDPEAYIENPARLDWDWLKSRLGVEP